MHLHERFPLRRYLGLSLLGLGCGFVGAMSGAHAASRFAQVTVTIPEIDLAPAPEPLEVASATSKHTERVAVSQQPGFVIELEGKSWFVLDVDPSTIVTHAKTRVENDEAPTSTIAMLRDRDLTAELRAWRGETVDVAGTCSDVVHDFALVHVLTGDPVYAAEDNPADGKWTRAMIDQHGTAYVVAKLEHCTGAYARSSRAEPIVAFKTVEQDFTKVDFDVAHATDDLMKSDVAADVKHEFFNQMADEHDKTSTFDKVTEITTEVAIDPRTSTKWVAVHAHADFMCGGPQINFWGLYRVEGDHVVAVKRAKLASLAQITSLIDVDGDGIPEVLGGGWISPASAIFDLDESVLASYDVPFFGCPC